MPKPASGTIASGATSGYHQQAQDRETMTTNSPSITAPAPVKRLWRSGIFTARASGSETLIGT
jgi:hypothetical protein